MGMTHSLVNRSILSVSSGKKNTTATRDAVSLTKVGREKAAYYIERYID